jgi:hypothetical protein
VKMQERFGFAIENAATLFFQDPVSAYFGQQRIEHVKCLGAGMLHTQILDSRVSL